MMADVSQADPAPVQNNTIHATEMDSTSISRADPLKEEPPADITTINGSMNGLDPIPATNDLLNFDQGHQGQGPVVSPPLSDSKHYDFDPLSSSATSGIALSPPSQGTDSLDHFGIQSPPSESSGAALLDLDMAKNIHEVSTASVTPQSPPSEAMDPFDPLQSPPPSQPISGNFLPAATNENAENIPPAANQMSASTGLTADLLAGLDDYHPPPDEKMVDAKTHRQNALHDLGVFEAPPPEEQAGSTDPFSQPPSNVDLMSSGVILDPGQTFDSPEVMATMSNSDILQPQQASKPDVLHHAAPPKQAFVETKPEEKVSVATKEENLLIEKQHQGPDDESAILLPSVGGATVTMTTKTETVIKEGDAEKRSVSFGVETLASEAAAKVAKKKAAEPAAKAAAKAEAKKPAAAPAGKTAEPARPKTAPQKSTVKKASPRTEKTPAAAKKEPERPKTAPSKIPSPKKKKVPTATLR